MLVKEVTSRGMLTLEKIGNMSRCSRVYIKAYYLLNLGIGLNGEVNDGNVGNVGTDKRRGRNDNI